MALTRKQAQARKAESLEELRDKFKRSKIAILTDYRGQTKGLSVKDISVLRSKLRPQDAEYKIVKNTLARKVANEMGISGLDKHFENPTAIAFGYKEPSTVAKVLTEFIKERKQNPLPQIKIGLMDGSVIDAKSIDSLASLPPKEVVLAQLLGLILAPHRQLMGLLKEPGRRMASIAHQIAERK